jgi:hypothetical protein
LEEKEKIKLKLIINNLNIKIIKKDFLKKKWILISKMKIENKKIKKIF